MDYAYNVYEPERLVTKNQILSSIKVQKGVKDHALVVPAADIIIPKRKGEESKASVIYEISNEVTAPVQRKENCGSIRVYWDGEYLLEVPLHFAEDVEKTPNIFVRLLRKIV